MRQSSTQPFIDRVLWDVTTCWCAQCVVRSPLASNNMLWAFALLLCRLEFFVDFTANCDPFALKNANTSARPTAWGK